MCSLCAVPKATLCELALQGFTERNSTQSSSPHQLVNQGKTHHREKTWKEENSRWWVGVTQSNVKTTWVNKCHLSDTYNSINSSYWHWRITYDWREWSYKMPINCHYRERKRYTDIIRLCLIILLFHWTNACQQIYGRELSNNIKIKK